jgi:hypothetical protein
MLNIVSSILAPQVATPTNSYESIATTTLSTTTASITFSSISSSYTHLQVRGIAKTSTAGTSVENMYIRLNGDTAANYALHYLMGSGAAASAGGAGSDTQMVGFNFIPQVGNTPFGTTVIDILDYANTNKYKTTRFLAGADLNGSGYVSLGSGLWMNTAAVTSITLLPGSGSFVQYSSFALYGIKG